MQLKNRKTLYISAFRLLAAVFLSVFCGVMTAAASEADTPDGSAIGGGYAATRQIKGAGYTSELYDASNGLPTPDANYVLGSSEGYIWIGGYGGIIRYDGSAFTWLDSSDGLTSGRGLYEDSKGRIWVGTNDNGVVVIDGSETAHFTYKDGMPSSSIRSFAEDSSGNVYIATTAGLCYVGADMKLANLKDNRVNGKRILKLDRGADGTIYGYTKNGSVFSVNSRRLTGFYENSELCADEITAFMADPDNAGMVYLCTDTGYVYYGRFGDSTESMKRISAAPITGIHWISKECGRIWIASAGQVGYLDESGSFCLLDFLPVNSGIEMLTSDYQGNIWIASSTQGVMKLVTNSFVDMFREAGLPAEVTNAACLHGGELYVGTDSGVRVFDESGSAVSNEFTEHIGGARVRCIKESPSGDLWAATYTNEMGLVCLTRDGRIFGVTEADGLPDNEVRCIGFKADGSVLAGTNGGLAVIKDEKVVRTVGAANGMDNTVLITIEEGENSCIYAGSDGGGIYVISDTGLSIIGRSDGLTSDVIMKIKRDAENGLYWIITSNSIEYMKDGVVTEVSTFPYNCNYDLSTFGEDMWVTSSHGIYKVKTEDMLKDKVSDYRVYTFENGLTGTPTAHTYCETDKNGHLYIPGRSGVCRIDTTASAEADMPLKAAISSVYSGDTQIIPDENGRYLLPAARGRIRITASVMDYTLTDPTVNVYMEGKEEEGLSMPLSSLQPLEYTGLEYGKYTLHIKVLDSTGRRELLDETFRIDKQPRIFEHPVIRTVIFFAAIAAAGFIVWRVMKSTVIRRQYEEIRRAKESAETSNNAKTIFLANISHELLTPMNTIVGMNEMAMRENADNVPKPYFMAMMNYCFDIRDASEQLLALINDLLDMSNIESGALHKEEQEYDTADMIRTVIKKTNERCADKGLTFETNVDELLPVRMYGDNVKIAHIIENLLSNAVKYTETGGVVFSASMLERENRSCKLRFSVKDTGAGIKQEDIGNIFSAYDSLDEQQSRSKLGTGLGLDISRRFAELMGGTLTCESEYGKGSEFILTLTQQMIDQTPVGDLVINDSGLKRGPYVPLFIAPDADILVVDESQTSREIFKGLLKDTRVFVSTAANIEDCIDKIKDTRFSVVFIDQMLIGTNGGEIIAKIRRTDPDLPVYILTANPASGEMYYTSIGFTGYFPKPIDGISLEGAIKKHIPGAMRQAPSVRQVSRPDPAFIARCLERLKHIDGIDAAEGIRGSGGEETFVSSAALFRDTIDANARIIRELYNKGSIKRLSAKLHALGSSARIIGAMALAAHADELSAAEKRGDRETIDKELEILLSEYETYKDRLAGFDENTAE